MKNAARKLRSRKLLNHGAAYEAFLTKAPYIQNVRQFQQDDPRGKKGGRPIGRPTRF